MLYSCDQAEIYKADSSLWAWFQWKKYKTILGYDPDSRCSYWTVIFLVKYQQELLVFTDRKVRLVGDVDVNIIGVDLDGGEK